MPSYYATAKRGDHLLWLIAFGLSPVLLLILVIMVSLAFEVAGIIFIKKNLQTVNPVAEKPEEVAVQIYPDMLRPTAPKVPAPKAAASIEAPAPPPVVTPAKPEMARTSEDQRGNRPDKPAFIGERDTEATSDRAPDASAPPLPSQSGRTPRDEGDIETTNSEYRDGKQTPLNQPAESVSPPSEAAAPEQVQSEAGTSSSPSPGATEQAASLPPPRENTLDGPEPVEVPMPREQKEQIDPSKEAVGKPGQKATQSKKTGAPITKLKQPIDDPAFSGNQRKTAIRGSISRTGRSSLDVADTPLGRYQAIIGRAVELEWQRNCARHRDFITPGYLTMRFFVESSGKVRSVQFQDGQTSEIQKGFTLNSIRDADIPPMPAALKNDYAKEPLELIFNFYF